MAREPPTNPTRGTAQVEVTRLASPTGKLVLQSSAAEALDHELRTRGIRVSVIEPAYTKTPFDAHFVEPDATLDEYREVRAAVSKRVQEAMATADEPRVVAEVVLRAATAARPKVRYTAGGVAGRLRFLRTFLPPQLMDAGIRKDLRLDTPPAARRGAEP